MSAFHENENMDIDQVVSRVKAGDRNRYALIIRHFQRKIYLYSYYLLGSAEEAEDAAQDIFIKGLVNIEQYTPMASFSAWLYKIAHHHCMDLLKKKNRSLKFWRSYRRDYAADPGNRYTDYIHELLECLNDEEQRILLLRSLENYTYEEIGMIMDLKPASVRKKFERLRKKLQRPKGGTTYESVANQGG